jgi:dienelactone hydrolase
VRIVDPWPAPESISGVRVEDVTFPTLSPFNPAALRHPREVPRTTGEARLFLPPGTPAAHSVPAVVLLHGAMGLVYERGEVYGPQLAAMGVAVMVVDTYGARRDLATDFIGRVLHITETMFVADAYAALRYLAHRPEIDAGHVVLAGFSYGGMATMYALYDQMARAFAPEGLRFAGHVSFYGPCIARFADSRTTGAPLLMLDGASDELIRPDRCAQIANDMRRGGSEVEIITYPGAVHQWDGGLSPRLIGRNLSGCSFTVERDGTVRDDRTLLPMSGVWARTLSLALCVSSKPYPIGRNDAVRAQSNRDFGAFLARVFLAAPVGSGSVGG